MQTALPVRPDWIEIQQTLGLAGLLGFTHSYEAKDKTPVFCRSFAGLLTPIFTLASWFVAVLGN